eukprot:15327285-Ditylum_brightwellii.AAC.2
MQNLQSYREPTVCQLSVQKTVGPYTIHRKGKYKNGEKKKDITLCCDTMINPVTSWFGIVKIKTKRSDVVSNVAETTWLTRYSYPTQVVLDKGTDFVAKFTEIIVSDYVANKKPITAKSPQANNIIERIHQTIGNMIRSFEVHNASIYEKDPWAPVSLPYCLALTAWLSPPSFTY